MLDTLVSAAVKQLAQDVLQDIFSEITASNYGAPVKAAPAPAAFDYKKLLAIREACSAVKMPVTDRALILDGAYYTNLLGDDVVAKGFIPQVAQPGIVEAQIRRLAGFDLHETVTLPENGEKLIGFAAHPSGLAVAMRYLVPAAEYDEAGAVTDPEIGLTFGYLRYTECTARKRHPTTAERILHSRRSGKRRAIASSSPSSACMASRWRCPTASSAS